MNVLVLGGCGIQGRAALYDLSRNPRVDQLTCADIQPGRIHSFAFLDAHNIISTDVDASDPRALSHLMDGCFDIVIDFLPPQFVRVVAEAAIQTGVSLVNTNYAYDILDLGPAAQEKGITILPECGLDPGIDLVLYNYSLPLFDVVHKLNSYCGGIPERAACDNPLNYKISWNIDAVLGSQMRDATLLADAVPYHIPAKDQHANAFIHTIEFPGVGKLEAIPNGDALSYAELLQLSRQLTEAGRYTLRWPGWCSFWHPLKALGFLGDEPIDGLPDGVSPREVVARLLEPQLQYSEGEKDLCVMVNKVEGLQGGKRKQMTCSLLIERDLTTGLMAMSMGVAYPACVAAELIVTGEISQKGILSPAVDIPCQSFMDLLKRRGVSIRESIEWPV